jgi:hypothetical protein
MTTATNESKGAAKNGMHSVAAALGSDKKGDEKGAAGAAASKEPKTPEAPKEIKTAEDLIKAIWASRGNLYIPVQDANFNVAVVKSDFVKAMQDMGKDAPAPYNLVKREGDKGADLVPFKKGTKT